MRRIAVVFTKELMDNARDRRSILSTLGYSLIGPGMILLMIVVLGSLFHDALEKPLELPLSGREHAPALVQFLEQNNVIVRDAPADPRAAVRAGDVDLVLVIPSGYGEDFTAGQPATVQIVVDNSRTAAMNDVQRARTLIEAYSTQIGALRLLARGISPTIVRAVYVEQVNVSTPQSEALVFLNMLPYLLVMAIFMGGAPAIIDMTAGERERNSLEPLLANPMKRWELVLGKLFASLPFVIVTIVFSLGAFWAIFTFFPIEQYMGTQLAVDVRALANIFLIILPMMLLAGAIQMLITTFSRTTKEAQAYVNWLPLVPALPGLFMAFLPIRATVWAMLIPTFGQQILINQFLRGEVVAPLHVAIATAATLVVSVVLVAIAIRLYGGEKILFGRK
jgi:sodium transport system permease protein